VRLLLFDIDGTLVNTLGAGKAALDTAMRGVYGETGPIESFDFHGKTDPAIVRGLLRAMDWPDAKIEAGFDATWSAYLEALERELEQRGGSSGAARYTPIRAWSRCSTRSRAMDASLQGS